jgi:hypothetical protein
MVTTTFTVTAPPTGRGIGGENANRFVAANGLAVTV